MVTGTALVRFLFPGAGDADADGAGAGPGFKGNNLGQLVHIKPDVLSSVDHHSCLTSKLPHSPSGNEVVGINRANMSRNSGMPLCDGLGRTVRACREGGVTPDISNGSAT